MKFANSYSLLILSFVLCSACEAPFLPSGSSVLSRQNAQIADVKVVPANARSAFHVKALLIGNDMLADVKVSLAKNVNLTQNQVDFVISTAKSKVEARVNALIIAEPTLALSESTETSTGTGVQTDPNSVSSDASPLLTIAGTVNGGLMQSLSNKEVFPKTSVAATADLAQFIQKSAMESLKTTDIKNVDVSSLVGSMLKEAASKIEEIGFSKEEIGLATGALLTGAFTGFKDAGVPTEQMATVSRATAVAAFEYINTVELTPEQKNQATSSAAGTAVSASSDLGLSSENRSSLLGNIVGDLISSQSADHPELVLSMIKSVTSAMMSAAAIEIKSGGSNLDFGKTIEQIGSGVVANTGKFGSSVTSDATSFTQSAITEVVSSSGLVVASDFLTKINETINQAAKTAAVERYPSCSKFSDDLSIADYLANANADGATSCVPVKVDSGAVSCPKNRPFQDNKQIIWTQGDVDGKTLCEQDRVPIVVVSASVATSTTTNSNVSVVAGNTNTATIANTSTSINTTGQTPVINTPTVAGIVLSDIFFDRVFPSNFVNQNSNVTYDFNNVLRGDDVGVTYSCLATSIQSPPQSFNCNGLPGSVSFGSLNGVFSWTPNTSARGAYAITVSGFLSQSTHQRTALFDIRENYKSSGLLLNLEANFARMTQPGQSGANFIPGWKDLVSSQTATLYNFPNTQNWVGDGSTGDPHALSFENSLEYVDAGNVLNSQTNMMFETWIKPISNRTTDVVLSNGDSAGHGLTLRASPNGGGMYAIMLGNGQPPGSPEYVTQVLGSHPIAYWRFGEASGTTINDSSGNNATGTVVGSVTYGQPGALFGSSDTGISFANGSYFVSSNVAIGASATIEVWAKSNSTPGEAMLWTLNGESSGPDLYFSGNQIALNMWDGQVGAYRMDPAIELPMPSFLGDGNYHHYVTVIDQNSNSKLYIDGVLFGVTAYRNPSSNNIFFSGGSWGLNWIGSLDEVAIYNSALSPGVIAVHYSAGKGTGLGAKLCEFPVANNTWQNIAGIFDYTSQNIKGFINGTQVCSFAATGSFAGSTNSLTLGKATYSGGTAWQGQMGSVRFYDNGTSADVLANYNATKDRYGNNQYFFIGNSPTAANANTYYQTLVRTDGTPSGTYALTGEDYTPNYGWDAKNYSNQYSANFNGLEYFIVDHKLVTPVTTMTCVPMPIAPFTPICTTNTTNTTTYQKELWTSDGSISGTHLLTNLGASTSTVPYQWLSIFYKVGSQLFFATDGIVGGVHRTQLWATDGTAGNTRNVNANVSVTGELAVFNDRLYFSGKEGTSGYQVLWVSDGTGAGTKSVKDLASVTGNSNPYGFTLVGSKLYFIANSNQLWKTDGTDLGTGPVLSAGLNVLANTLFNFQNKLYFSGGLDSTNFELWRSDGVTTELVKEINPSTGSNIYYFASTGPLLYFRANEPTNGNTLWVSDGTTANTVPLGQGLNANTIVSFKGKAYFAAYTVFDGYELWQSDGTVQGTLRVKDISAGTASSYPSGFAIVGDYLYFGAYTPALGQEQYLSDGSTAGTRLLVDFAPGTPDGKEGGGT